MERGGGQLLRVVSGERSGAQLGTKLKIFYVLVMLVETFNRQLSKSVLEVISEGVSLGAPAYRWYLMPEEHSC